MSSVPNLHSHGRVTAAARGGDQCRGFVFTAPTRIVDVCEASIWHPLLGRSVVCPDVV
jgi:hypothetical protein